MPPMEGKTVIVNDFGITKDIIEVTKKHYESNYLQSKAGFYLKNGLCLTR